MDVASPQSASQSASLRSLLSLAWPVVLARATQSVIGFCDALMVAPLGEEPLAAATTGALNTFALIILPMGVAFIVQSFAAQLRGRGELAAIPRYAFYGLALAIVAGVISVLSIPFVPAVLGRLGYSPNVHTLMSEYLAIRLLSVAPAVGIEALSNWYGGLGRTRPGMVAGLVAMVANVAGNYLLIMPRFGLPGMGVAGAAWASTASTFLGFFVILWLFLREREGGVSPRAAIRTLHMHEFLRVLRFGLPNGVNWFLEFAAFAMFINLVVGHLGTTVLASFNVVMQINSISFMPAFGLSSAGAILVGEAIGQRAYQKVWSIVRMTGIVNGVWMGSVGLLYVAASTALVGLFEPAGLAGQELVRIGAGMLAVSALWQLFDAVGLTLGEALRAAGDTAWCMGARIVLAWFVFMPLAWAAVRWYAGGVTAVMTAMIVYVFLIAVTMGARFASGKWRSIDLVGEPRVI